MPDLLHPINQLMIVADAKPANPACPNCGRPMALISPPNGEHDHHNFECSGCKVVYMTEDHTPVSGRHPSQAN